MTPTSHYCQKYHEELLDLLMAHRLMRKRLGIDNIVCPGITLPLHLVEFVMSTLQNAADDLRKAGR